MSIASLGIKLGDKVFALENGTLRYIDSITKEFKDEKELMNDNYYRDKIKTYSIGNENNNSRIILNYIKNNEDKKELKLLLNDPTTIRTRTSSLEEVKSETEKARKLLLNSKNQIFLTSFLLNKHLESTTLATVRMTIDEYKIAKREGYNVVVRDGEYRITIKDVLKYRLNHKKLGSMRLLVEDTLEVWKKNMLNLNDEDLYFYSRELHFLLDEYNYRKIPRKAVDNLSFNKEHLRDKLKIKRYNNFHLSETIGLLKRKILEDRKAS